MTREEAIKFLSMYNVEDVFTPRCVEAHKMAIEALKQVPRRGQWLRMSDLSEQEDDRYKCSYCGNVIRHKNKMNLYIFNSWCGRCGSDNEEKSRWKNE